MNRDLLEKFLAGNATDAERQQVETILGQAGTVVDQAWISAGADSLIEALAHGPSGAEGADDDQSEAERRLALIQKIEAMVPRQAIGREELDQVLDPPEQPDELGRISRFLVTEFVASGGMGLVFKARDPELERDVCIKIMHPALLAQPQVKLRFEREARAAARIQSERIVTVLEVGEHRQLPYLVMPLLDGESLGRRLQRDGRLDPDEAAQVAIQVAQGLSYAHAHGYLHRDIKPDNIWLTPEGDVILLDLGLARSKDGSVDLTHAGTVLGTPCYMSPEQVQGQTLGESSDLFSLGIVLYEMLTGVSPFDRENVFSTMMSVANDTLPALVESAGDAIPEPLMSVVRRLLNKEPDKRPQSAEEVIRLLEEALDGKRSVQRPISFWGRLGYAIAGGIAVLLIAWASWLIYVKTDKGTLVVEADDSVRIEVAKESLTVRDPKTGKQYVVRVGEQQLPSGVYALEVEDPTRGLVFSTAVVALRRGETQLVRVELRSDERAAGGGLSDTVPGTVPAGKKQAVRVAEAAGFRLADLPPLSAAETRQALGLEPGKPITPFATVQSPCELKGVDSWSIEPARPFFQWVNSRDGRQVRLSLSPDGRRIASVGYYDRRSARTMVYVWNRSFQLTHMLPVSGDYGSIYWSPDPNVLAVLCRGDRRQAIIWRLRAGHAEISQTIPVASAGMCWSPRGDQIAFRTAQGLEFYRLTDRTTYSIPDSKIHGSIDNDAWSPDGRLLSTKEKDAVYVWSLESGQMVHHFPKAKSSRWLKSDARLLLEQGDETQTWYEVWNMESMVREDFFALPLDWHAGSFACDDQFEKFAVMTKDDQLVMGAVHGEHAKSELDVEQQQINPSGDDRSQSIQGDIVTGDIQVSGGGEVVLLTLATKAAVVLFDEMWSSKSIKPKVDLVHVPPPNFFLQDYRFSRVLLDRSLRPKEGEISLRTQVFDLQQLAGISPHYSYRWGLKGPGDEFKNAGCSISPWGTYWAYATSTVTRNSQASVGSDQESPAYESSTLVGIQLADKTGVEYYYQIETDMFLQRMDWHAGDGFLVLIGSNGATKADNWRGKIGVLDVANKQSYDIPIPESQWVTNSDMLRPAEIGRDRMGLDSRLVGNRLYVPVKEPVLGLLPPQQMYKITDELSVSSRTYVVNRVLLQSFDLETGEQADSQSLGYFLNGPDYFDIAGDWIVLHAPRAPTELCDEFLASGKSRATVPREQFGDWWHRQSQSVHVLPLPNSDKELPESTNEQSVKLFKSLGLPDARSPHTVLSSDGEYIYVYGRSLSTAVFSTAKMSQATSVADADKVIEVQNPDLGELYSPDRPRWHYAYPVLARRTRSSEAWGYSYDRSVSWYDASKKTMREFHDCDGDVSSIRSMPFGWAVHDKCSVLAFDQVGNYLGRWVDGSPLDTEPKDELNCWIDASGAILSTLSTVGYSAVILSGNRFTVMPLDEFQSQFSYQLPSPVDPFQTNRRLRRTVPGWQGKGTR